MRITVNFDEVKNIPDLFNDLMDIGCSGVFSNDTNDVSVSFQKQQLRNVFDIIRHYAD